jgi:hypothetical protein
VTEPTTFREDVDKLTSAFHEFIDTDDGKRLVTFDSLLTQLREAVSLGLEGGGSSQFGSRMTIAPNALDLANEIDAQAREALLAATGTTPFGRAERHIRLWFAAVNESTMVEVRYRRQHPDELVDAWRKQGRDDPAVWYELDTLPAYALARQWVSRIEALLTPPQTREIPGKCPACDESHVHRVRDGETIRSTAMAFLRDEQGRTTEARCAACGARWLPTQFEWLARAVNAKPLPELQHAGEQISES